MRVGHSSSSETLFRSGFYSDCYFIRCTSLTLGIFLHYPFISSFPVLFPLFALYLLSTSLRLILNPERRRESIVLLHQHQHLKWHRTIVGRSLPLSRQATPVSTSASIYLSKYLSKRKELPI